MVFRLAMTVAFLMTLIGCSEQNFSAGGAKGGNGLITCKTETQKNCIQPPEPPPPPLPPPPPSSIEHEAVFAVRNMSCAFCHAKIESNVISDFAMKAGQANAAYALAQMTFMAQDKRTAAAGQSISGKFIIPAGNTYTTAVAAGEPTCDAKDLSVASLAYKEVSLFKALDQCVKSHFTWGNQNETFVTRKTVEINPVSSPDTIAGIVEAGKLTTNGFALVGSSTMTGITGTKTNGFKSSASISCEGAVIFDAPLLLENTTISTQKGCRIYSTGSIFVFGALNVQGPLESAHLQLMSPTFVGFDISLTHIKNRLLHDANSRQTFSIGSTTAVSNKITSDGTKLGVSGAGSGASAYSKVAVSAPVVYSKNSGQFSGVIIAEQFLGRIGSLSFRFDPIFKKGTAAPALFPEIKSQLVTVSDD